MLQRFIDNLFGVVSMWLATGWPPGAGGVLGALTITSHAGNW